MRQPEPASETFATGTLDAMIETQAKCTEADLRRLGPLVLRLNQLVHRFRSRPSPPGQ